MVLKGLVKLFKRNEEATDKWNKRIDTIRAGLDVFAERIMKTIKALKLLLSFKFKEFGKEVKETWEGTGDAIRAAVEEAGVFLCSRQGSSSGNLV